MLAALAGYPVIGSLLVAAAFGSWTWSSPLRMYAAGAYPVQTASWHRLLLATAVIVFMVGGLVPYLRLPHGFGHGSVPSSRHRWRLLAGGGRRQPAERVHRFEEPPTGTSEGDPGIILWPMHQAITQVLAPLPVLKAGLASGRDSDPLVIPFNGVYWFFKAPETQPPKTSRQARANPEAVEIRSTDRRPLSIEAHDHLGRLIDLDCCSSIQISIRNADRYPDTVSLELVLVNTSLPEKPSQSLGSLLVKSTHPWKLYEKSSPVSETLNFAIPPRRSIRRFDEVKIVFRLDRARADTGAKIAIDHFVLVPRGL